MTQTFITAQNISFTYSNQLKELLNDFSTSFSNGWTGVVGPNGVGKSTLLKILAGLITPDCGKIIHSGSVLYVDQVCEKTPPGLFELLARSDSEALFLISVLELQYDWPYRWHTLSHGEKKRSQIGAAIAEYPDVLLLDEPVNHLDSKSCEQVSKAMSEYRGCGVVVSHNKELLDRFCGRSLFFPEGIIYPGGYSKAVSERERLEKEQKRDLESLRNEKKRLNREVSRRRALAAGQQKRRSKRHLDLKDSDGRAKRDLARISGRDGTGGKLLRQMDGRISFVQDRVDSFSIPKEIRMGITFHSNKKRSDFLWRRSKGRIFYNGKSGLFLSHDNLEVRPGDRLLISGNNGTGKTTLMNQIYRETHSDSWYLKQEMDRDEQEKLKQSFGKMDKEIKGRVISSLRRMGAVPEDFLTLHEWSPGEVKKLALAMALEQIIPGKSLLLLDEPMNHLDLISSELLEEALAAFPGAIVLISHDDYFLNRVITEHWKLEKCETGSCIQ